MPRYIRPRLPGATIFFTVCLAARGSTFLSDNVESLRLAIAQTRRERPFTIDAFVVLPDHLHCLWTLPQGDADYATRWGAIKARFSMAARRAGFTPPPPTGRANGGVNPALRRKGQVGLWQNRFWEHHIRNDRDFADHLHYCWWNPVQHGLVDHPEAWPFSSVHRDRRMGLFDGISAHSTAGCNPGGGVNPALRRIVAPLAPVTHPSSTH